MLCSTNVLHSAMTVLRSAHSAATSGDVCVLCQMCLSTSVRRHLGSAGHPASRRCITVSWPRNAAQCTAVRRCLSARVHVAPAWHAVHIVMRRTAGRQASHRWQTGVTQTADRRHTAGRQIGIDTHYQPLCMWPCWQVPPRCLLVRYTAKNDNNRLKRHQIPSIPLVRTSSRISTTGTFPAIAASVRGVCPSKFCISRA